MTLLDCGDIADVTNNKGLFLPDSACSVACSGDALHTCGADKALNTYYSGGGPTWRTPGNIGRFEASSCSFLVQW